MNDLDNNVIRELQNKNAYFSKENEELKYKIKQLTSEASKLPEL